MSPIRFAWACVALTEAVLARPYGHAEHTHLGDGHLQIEGQSSQHDHVHVRKDSDHNMRHALRHHQGDHHKKALPHSEAHHFDEADSVANASSFSSEDLGLSRGSCGTVLKDDIRKKLTDTTSAFSLTGSDLQTWSVNQGFSQELDAVLSFLGECGRAAFTNNIWPPTTSGPLLKDCPLFSTEIQTFVMTLFPKGKGLCECYDTGRHGTYPNNVPASKTALVAMGTCLQSKEGAVAPDTCRQTCMNAICTGVTPSKLQQGYECSFYRG